MHLCFSWKELQNNVFFSIQYKSVFIAVIFLSGSVISQQEKSSLTIRYFDGNKIALPDEVFVLYKEKDSIGSCTTNAQGECKFDINLDVQSEYTVVEPKHYYTNGNTLSIKTEDFAQDYILEMTQRKSCTLRNNYQVFFGRNMIEPVHDIEMEFLNQLISDHPNICIEFTQAIVGSESEEIARQRMNQFRLFIENNCSDIDCVQFSDQLHYLPELQNDQRSRIEAVIAGLDSKCN